MMKRVELDLEHHYKNKFIGRHRFLSGGRALVIGQSKEADIRLMGDDVSSVHAFIEYNNGTWSVLDAGSARGTWVAKRPVVEEAIHDETVVTIGGHYLKLVPKLTETEVFSEKSLLATDGTAHIESAEVTKYAGGAPIQTFHQVIVRKNGYVQSTQLLSKDKNYIFSHNERAHQLPPPKPEEVKHNQFGAYTVTQRLIDTKSISFQFLDVFKGAHDPEMRIAGMVSLVCLLIIALLIFAIPHKPTENLTDLKPDNKYNRMIFDAELVKKKRAEAKEMRKTIMAAGRKSEQPQMQNRLVTPTKSNGAPQKVVSKLKLQGLSALLGKIAKRANAKGPMVVGFGKIADDANTGTSNTMSPAGSLQNVATGKAGSGEDVYKVAAVGTFGKGGGKSGSSLSGLSGLSAEGIGSGTVGIIEQETEIEGGLDKEIIAQYIKNYLGEIRYCYERQLSAEPDLYGKVQVKFTIDGSGSVSEYRVGASTLKSAMVEGCILRRLARWKFPKPRGGTNVLVTYPFMFKATN